MPELIAALSDVVPLDSIYGLTGVSADGGDPGVWEGNCHKVAGQIMRFRFWA
ncbi:hypothetical protein [Herbidospora mongoliensis]|uniref:hypothetical protein n=1 Tax=Herbidospora mongoliensis TaxID=688067 RepID=UPI000A58B32E|nr:hypothetical protein [Herbidospora mongoliensis]